MHTSSQISQSWGCAVLNTVSGEHCYVLGLSGVERVGWRVPFQGEKVYFSFFVSV